MNKSGWWHQPLIIAVAGILYFTSLGATRLWDEDEGFFATAAAEMHRRDDWIVPTFNEEVFSHKPPFMFWMMRLGFYAFGVTELGARFGSAVFAVMTAVLVYHLGRILFSRRVGFWAAICLATSLMWSVVARAATADCYLVFFMTASLLVYVREVFGSGLIHSPPIVSENTAAVDAVLDRWLPRRFGTYAVIYALMALAVLVKGPIGMLLPGVTIALFVLFQMPRDRHEQAGLFARFWSMVRPFVGKPLLQTFWRMRPLTAIAALLLLTGPWFVLVGYRTQGVFLQEFFGVHNVGRFLQPMENHRGPIVYYLPVLLVGLFPWSIFVLPVVGHASRNAVSGEDRAKFQFAMCWAVCMVGFFSIARTKLPNYVLPAYPALSILVAAWVEAWIQERERTWARWPSIAFGSLLAVGVLLFSGLTLIGRGSSRSVSLAERIGINEALAPELARIAWIGVIPAACAGLGWWAFSQRNRRLAVGIVAATGVMFTGAVLIFAAKALDAHQTSADLMTAVRREAAAGSKLAAFRHFPPSLIFYAGRRVERFHSPEEANAFLAAPGQSFLVTTDGGLEQMADASGRRLKIVAELPRFPKPGVVAVATSDVLQVADRLDARSVERR